MMIANAVSRAVGAIVPPLRGWAMRSIENPAVPLGSMDHWPWDQGTASGVRVTRDTALMYPAFWRGVSLISRDVAKLPLITYKRKGEGKERDTNHPAYRLLKSKPNDEMTALVFRQTLQAHALCSGNGYAYIPRAGDATPLELIPLNPDCTWPVRENGRLLYVTEVESDGKREQRKLLPDNVLHIKGLGFDGLVGYNVIQYARNTLGLGLAAQQYGSRFFSNNATPSVVIEVPNAMKPEAAREMLSNWNALHSGVNNSHRAGLLTAGAKLNPYSVNARESQLMELRGFELREISNVLGLPPHRLGDDTRQSHSSLEQENQSYLDDALDGWLCNWEAECADKLLTEEEKERDTHVIEFMRQALVRADLPARGEYYAKALGGRPWMTQDQVRSLENMNPVGGSAAELLDPPNTAKGVQTTGGDDDEPEDDDPPETDAGDNEQERAALVASVRSVIVHAAGRMAKRLAEDARRMAKKPSEFTDYLDQLDKRHASTIADELSAAIGPASVLTGRTIDAAAMAAGIIADVRQRLDDVSGRCTADELPEGVNVCMTELESSMPAKVAADVFDTQS